MTISLVAVFIPVLFLGGLIGRLFEEFAVTIGVAILVSGVVSLTLTPMLCSRFLEVGEKHGRVYWMLERFFKAMDRAYRSSLAWALEHRWIVVAAAVGATLSSLYFFRALPVELAPQQDEGKFFIAMRAPAGSSIHYMERKLAEAERARLEQRLRQAQTTFDRQRDELVGSFQERVAQADADLRRMLGAFAAEAEAERSTIVERLEELRRRVDDAASLRR
jgi:multidrug efflux pump subunit AcrB